MNNKILIIGGIVITIFVVFLVVICGGGTGAKNIPKEPELKKIVKSVTCEIQGEENINYDVNLLTDNKQFNPELQYKNYVKIKFDTLKTFNSLGVAFIIKSSADERIKLSLKSGENLLKQSVLDVKKNTPKNVELVLEKAVEIPKEKELYILIETTNNSKLIFDTILFFVSEV